MTLGEVRKGKYKKLVGLKVCSEPIYVMASSIHTLDGFPEKVEGGVIVSLNDLTTFESTLKEVTKDFDGSGNPKVTSLKGLPKVGGGIKVNKCALTSMTGIQKIVKGDLECSDNKLTNLEGFPEDVEGSVHLYHNDIDSLKGSLKLVKKNLNLKSTKFISKESIIEEVINNNIVIHGEVISDFGRFYISHEMRQSFKASKKMGKFKDFLDL